MAIAATSACRCVQCKMQLSSMHGVQPGIATYCSCILHNRSCLSWCTGVHRRGRNREAGKLAMVDLEGWVNIRRTGGGGISNKLTLAQQFPFTTSHLLFPWRLCEDGMMVEGRDYRFTTFQARESSLVEERAAFFVKMQQEGVSEHSSHFACTRICPAKHLSPVPTGDKIRSCFRIPHHVVLAQYRNQSGQARLRNIRK